jgi:hypothetical protein
MASNIVRDRALCDLIDSIDAACERLTDTRENLKEPTALRDAAYIAGDVLAAAASYLEELREERLRGRAA